MASPEEIRKLAERPVPESCRCAGTGHVQWCLDNQILARAALDGLRYRAAWEEMLPLFDAWNEAGWTGDPLDEALASCVETIRARLATEGSRR